MKGKIVIICFGLFSCRHYQPLATVASVDLQKYAGKWYEIAAFPQPYEKGCSCVSAEYILAKNKVKVINSCYKASGRKASISGTAFTVKNSNNSKLKVQFFWPFKGDYWIIELADDYSWAAVGSPDRKTLWILAREKKMDESLYQSVVEKLKQKGFDISKLRLMDQSCEK